MTRHDSTVRSRPVDPSAADRRVVTSMYVGLSATIVATAVPFLDRALLERHIRSGYPTYGGGRIDAAADLYLVYLSVVGVLGVSAWLVTLRLVRSRHRRAPVVALVLFLTGMVVGSTDLFVRDTSGDTGLPPAIGWLGVAPCLPGLIAVTALWRRRGRPIPPLDQGGPA